MSHEEASELGIDLDVERSYQAEEGEVLFLEERAREHREFLLGRS